jgi:hypothetical protein
MKNDGFASSKRNLNLFYLKLTQFLEFKSAKMNFECIEMFFLPNSNVGKGIIIIILIST